MKTKEEAEVPKDLTQDEATQVAGGEGDCTSTVGVDLGVVSVNGTGATVGDALIGLYDGVVDATSHVIGTVADALKK